MAASSSGGRAADRLKRRKKKSPVVANPGAMKDVLAARKVDTVVLGKINTHLLAREDGPRDKTRLHPSEMAKSDWCPRRSFYALSPDHPAEPEEDRSFVLENIFEEGHEVHAKYQNRLWDMGLLRGRFHCHICSEYWDDTSPASCPSCGAPRFALEYKEVWFRDDDYLITGHSDGDLAFEDPTTDPLLEIKTVGIGTVRFEYPSLLFEHTQTVEIYGKQKTITDLEALWNDIKRPFPSHLRQAMLYMHFHGRKRMVFIYECKWNQKTKEFVVKYRRSMVEPLLDLALDVKYGLESGRPPARPAWADLEEKTCQKCPYVDTCYDTENRDAEHRTGADGEGSREEEAGGSRRSARGARAELRNPDGTSEAVRVVRRRSHASLRRSDEVD